MSEVSLMNDSVYFIIDPAFAPIYLNGSSSFRIASSLDARLLSLQMAKFLPPHQELNYTPQSGSAASIMQSFRRRS